MRSFRAFLPLVLSSRRGAGNSGSRLGRCRRASDAAHSLRFALVDRVGSGRQRHAAESAGAGVAQSHPLVGRRRFKRHRSKLAGGELGRSISPAAVQLSTEDASRVQLRNRDADLQPGRLEGGQIAPYNELSVSISTALSSILRGSRNGSRHPVHKNTRGLLLDQSVPRGSGRGGLERLSTGALVRRPQLGSDSSHPSRFGRS